MYTYLYLYIYLLIDKIDRYLNIYTYMYFEIGRSTKRFLVFFNLFILFLHSCMFPACCFRQRTYMAQDLVNGELNET